MVDSPNHIVKIHTTVEEPPGHVTHERRQKVANVHGVRQWAAIAGCPCDVRKILVPSEPECAEFEFTITSDSMRFA